MGKNINDWQATKKWYAIPKETRKALEENVFCVSCRDVTTIVDYQIAHLKKDIMLKGTCNRCGERVNRVIESE